MKKGLFTVIAAICVIACTKKNSTNQVKLPIASFSVVGDTLNNVITIATYDQYQLFDGSSNAVSYLWDFGNDSVYKQKNPVLWYPKSGTYLLTLTVQNANGQKTSISKTVKVLDRVIKKVIINGLTNFNYPANPSLNKPNVWATIKLGGNNTSYPVLLGTNSSFSAPILYQSPIVSNFNSANIPYTFTVTNKIVIDFPALAELSESGLGYKGIGYGLELYAQDPTGTYLLSSSYAYYFSSQSGSITWPVANIQKNIFVIRYGNIDVVCDYE